MKFKKVTFPRSQDAEFVKTLRARVNEYFKENNISRYANGQMVFKTIFMILLYSVPYFLLVFGVADLWWEQMILWSFMGLGMAGIGLSVMHDANHGAYSRKAAINKILGHTINVLGGFDTNWKLQHNVLHHSYTNVHGMDQDIKSVSVLRFTPHDRRRWFHRFQFIYAWGFYSLMTLYWMTAKDFVQLNGFKRQNLADVRQKFGKLMSKMITWKAIYYLYIMAIPLIVVPGAWYWVLIGFVIMHLIAGSILSAIFQPAHVMPDTEFPVPTEKGTMENNWAIHQLLTTTNFAPKSRIFSWFVGGLNFQIEHHLFPNICHVHYKKISKIVKETAQEYGLPYYSQPNFAMALIEHTRFLKRLGKS